MVNSIPRAFITKDVIALSKLIGDIATGQVEDVEPRKIKATRESGVKGGAEHEAFYAADKCVLREDAKPCAFAVAVLHGLQLRSHSQDLEDYARTCRWHH